MWYFQHTFYALKLFSIHFIPMKQFQFNIRLNKQSNVAYLTNLWEDYSLFPMMWIEEFAELDEKYKVKLDHMLADPLMGIFVAQWALVR